MATAAAELHSPIELFFTTSKIVTRSWLEPASYFAFASGSKSCGLFYLVGHGVQHKPS